MISHRKTPVAVLRTMLGLSVDEFAKLIDKAPSTINSLESGRLALSPDTALIISAETGVALDWLLTGKQKDKPYVIESCESPRQPYTREHFEKTQAAKLAGPTALPNEFKILFALDTIAPWLSVFYSAYEQGQPELARFLMRDFIEQLSKRFGKDEDAALESNRQTRITFEGKEYQFVNLFGRLGLFSSKAAENRTTEQLEADALKIMRLTMKVEPNAGRKSKKRWPVARNISKTPR